MPDSAHWFLFLSASLVLCVTPGPSIMYVVSRALVLGWRAAVLSSVGLALGDLLQVIATALGLAGLLVSAPRLFTGVKLAGGLYLMWLGIQTLMGKGVRINNTDIRSQPPLSPKSLIFQGFLALNPKTLLFFVAFLPQFVTSRAGSLRSQIILFGMAFVVLGFVTNSAFGCIGGKLAESAGQKFQLATRIFGGVVLIGLGVLAVVTPTPARPT